MLVASDLGVSNPDVIRIRGIIDPYLTPIATFLTPAPAAEDGEVAVNSEHESGTSFTVHTGADVTPSAHRGVEPHVEEKTETTSAEFHGHF
jgi:hypothetical protein